MWAWATLASASTGTEIAQALAVCRPGLAAPLPDLSSTDLEALASGEVLRLLHHDEDPEKPSTAVGMAVLKGSVQELWIAAQDPHAVVDPTLAEFVVRDFGQDHALWYGHLDLPRPIKDRQWVVESQDSQALAKSTGGRCWEHHWALDADAMSAARDAVSAGAHPEVTLAMMDDAVLTPVNSGAWLMAPLGPDRTLVAYQATTVVGGAIPDWLVAELARARLEEVLRSLETRASTWAHEHYLAGHSPVPGADGAPIAPFPR